MKIYFINRSVICRALFIFSILASTIFISRFLVIHVNNKPFNESNGVIRSVKVNGKLVALTFDDGPGATFTTKILDLLKRHQAKATFFVIGEQVEKNPEILLREVKEGHEIGNHMYKHREVFRISPIELREDLDLSHKTVYQIIKKQMRLYRPTSGYYNKSIIEIAQSLNYVVVLWNLDSRDWTRINGRVIAKNILKSVKPGSIFLFHDFGGNRNNTIEALRIILPELNRQGYQLVTVSELLRQVN